MFHPQTYNNHNILQRTYNLRYLQEYNQTFNLRSYSSSVLDIGSGDGDFTSNVLVDFLQHNFTELIGCDKNEQMIQFANKYYKKDRVSFEVYNIEETVPKTFYNHFDLIFSFFVFNWIQNQAKAFSNVYDLLTPGGGFFFVFVERSPVYEIYRTINNMTRWKPYTSFVEDIVSPYHDCPDPEAKVKEVMSQAGFTDIYAKSIKTSYQYDSKDDFKAGMAALNVFPIPENDFEDYLNDLVRVAYDDGYISVKHILKKLNIIVARASKSF